VVGIDPVTGTKKFSVEIPDSEDHQAEQYGVMIAGDGYAYVPYAYRTGGNPQSNHFRVLRISSSGAWDDIKVMDFTGPGTGDDFSPYDVYMMTNADQGIVLNWEGVEGPGWQRTPRMAITTGTSASIISMPSVPGQDVAFPVLQAQDGTFLGTSGPYMIDFDATGKVLWSVAGNYAPTIATADGGVIAQSYDPDTGELTGTVTFDQNGNATGQMASLPTYSWLGNAYQDGPVNQVLATPPKRAASFSPNPGANPSGNTTAVKRVPTTLVITKVLSVIQDCYSSLGNSSSGSYAQRNITYEVADQYKSRMDGGMQIQERLLPASDTPCPKGTNWQSGACVGDWINKDDEFPDTLSANPGTGHSEYIQTFWVATPPSTPGYAPFYGQIQIDAYKPSPSGASSLTLTQFVVDVNGNTGMNPNGPPIRRCH
jgi:hypothetical protein